MDREHIPSWRSQVQERATTVVHVTGPYRLLNAQPCLAIHALAACVSRPQLAQSSDEQVHDERPISVADIARRNVHSKNSEGERIAAQQRPQRLATRSSLAFQTQGSPAGKKTKNEMHAGILAFHM